MNAASREEVFAELRKRGKWLLDFLHLYVAKDIMTEFLGAAEKLMFRFGESQSCPKFEFEQVKCANEIRDQVRQFQRKYLQTDRGTPCQQYKTSILGRGN